MRPLLLLCLFLSACAPDPIEHIIREEPTLADISILAVGQSYLTKMGNDTSVIDSNVMTLGSNVRTECPTRPYEGNINGHVYTAGWEAGYARELGFHPGGGYTFNWIGFPGKWGIGGVASRMARHLSQKLRNRINIVTAAQSGAPIDFLRWNEDYVCWLTANGHRRLSLLPSTGGERFLLFYQGAGDSKDSLNAHNYRSRLREFISESFNHGYQHIIIVQTNPNSVTGGVYTHSYKHIVMEDQLDMADGQHVFTIPEWLMKNGADKAQADNLHPSPFAMDSVGAAIADLMKDILDDAVDIPEWDPLAVYDGTVCTWRINSSLPVYATPGTGNLKSRFTAWNNDTKVTISSVSISNNTVYIYPTGPITKISYLYGWGQQNQTIYLRNGKQYGFLPYKTVLANNW